MRGVLADENMEGLVGQIRRLLTSERLDEMLDPLGIQWFEFAEVGLTPGISDRSVWNFCQAEGLILLTDNRNCLGVDSLEATMRDFFRVENLPVLTIGNKLRFQKDRNYAIEVVWSLADVLDGLFLGLRPLGESRIFIPDKRSL